jgi:hypothetical protein
MRVFLLLVVLLACFAGHAASAQPLLGKDETPTCKLEEPVDFADAPDSSSVKGCGNIKCIAYTGATCSQNDTLAEIYLPDSLSNCSSGSYSPSDDTKIRQVCARFSDKWANESITGMCKTAVAGFCAGGGKNKPDEDSSSPVVWILVGITFVFAGFSLFLYYKSRRDTDNPYLDLGVDYVPDDNMRV